MLCKMKMLNVSIFIEIKMQNESENHIILEYDGYSSIFFCRVVFEIAAIG